MKGNIMYHLVNTLVISVAVSAGIGIAATYHSIKLEMDYECLKKGREMGIKTRIISGECYARMGESAWLNGIDYKEQKARRKKR